MSQQAGTESETFVLQGLSWDQYLAVLDVLGHHRLRHCFADGEMELWRTIYDVTWQEYVAFLEVLGDVSCRHQYANGTLEMMSPRKDHDWMKRFLGRIVEHVSMEFDIDIQCIGSTTITSAVVERGFQPDEAYYIANEPRVRGKDLFEPDVDPPPDLLIEVDVTSSSASRLPSFAAMGVPEVWRLVDHVLEFLRLQPDGHYASHGTTASFPMLTTDDVHESFEKLATQTENRVLRDLVAKLRVKNDQ